MYDENDQFGYELGPLITGLIAILQHVPIMIFFTSQIHVYAARILYLAQNEVFEFFWMFL